MPQAPSEHEPYPDEDTRRAVDDDPQAHSTDENDLAITPDNTPVPMVSDATSDNPTSEADDQPADSGPEPTEESAEDTDLDAGFITDGLTRNEVGAFAAAFVASYGLAAIFYWGMISQPGGLSQVPLPMWLLLGFVVVCPLALMFGLQQTSDLATTILNKR